MLKEFYTGDFEAERFGLVSGSAIAAAFPNVPAKLARFVAYGANIGRFYIGRDGNVTYELAAGTQTDWFSVVGDNLNVMQFRSPSGTADKLAFWVQY